MNSISLIPRTTELHSRDQAERQGDASRFSFPCLEESAKTLLTALWTAVPGSSANYSPVVVYGPSGIGKTRTVGELAARFRSHQPTGKTVLANGDDFAREYASAVELDSLGEFRRKYRAADFLVIDGLEQLAEKTSAQLELLYTADAVHTRRRWLVATARSAPVQLTFLHAGLRSRLTGGLTVPLCCPWTPDSAPTALVGSAQRKNTNLRDITRRVARYFHLKQAELTGSSRRQGIVHARNVAIYLCRTILGTSYEELGRQFGGRDHSTVLHAFQRVVASLDSEQETRQAVRELVEQLSAD